MPEKEIKLSVIVPVYNAGLYLGRCLDSLLNQGLRNEEYEIVCVNDGSTDKSCDILTRYEKEYPEVIKVANQRHRGLPAARNAGMRMANGEVLTFCDADDYMAAGAYSYILKNFWRKDVNLLKFCSVTLDNRMMKKWQEPASLTGSVMYDGDAFGFLEKRGSSLSFVWSYMYRRSFLIENDIWFSDLRQCEDIDFNLSVVLKNPRMVHVNVNAYRYTTSSGQLTRRRKPFFLKRVIQSYLKLFSRMVDAVEAPGHVKDALEGYAEREMVAFVSRLMSARLTSTAFWSVKARLTALGILPLHSLGRNGSVINMIMSSYCAYYVASALYRFVFIPCVLPFLSRN